MIYWIFVIFILAFILEQWQSYRDAEKLRKQLLEQERLRRLEEQRRLLAEKQLADVRKKRNDMKTSPAFKKFTPVQWSDLNKANQISAPTTDELQSFPSVCLEMGC
jgi:hypothetical protein